MDTKKKKMKREREEEEAKETKNNNPEMFASCSFLNLGLHPTLCDQLRERMGFEAPTTVQAQAIPVVLSGRHVLVNAATGTGKTVAYLAPIIHHLQSYSPRIERAHGTFALVLVPTRELCLQVYEILQGLLHRFHWIVPGYIMGGESRSKEKARLRKGISILVATPGRLLDHLKNTSSFSHTNLRWIIFDEADRILELGFGKEIEDILDLLGSRLTRSVGKGNRDSSISNYQRQNLLLSATLNEKVNHLANISLENPVMIGLDDEKMQPEPLLEHTKSLKSDADDELEHPSKVLKPSTGDFKVPVQLVQKYVKVPCGSRLATLLSILKHLFEKRASQKIVVFFSTCDAVDFHYSLLSEFRFSCTSQSEAEAAEMFLRCKTFRLHGNMKQEDRRDTFQAFKSDKLALLLSTDVAARGLDLPKVTWIIQYDTPGEATEYVHRVGRTARMGEKGDSLLFLQPVEVDYLQELQKHGVSLTEYPILKMLDSFSFYEQMHRNKKFVSLESHPWLLSLQKALESFIAAQPKMNKLAQNAFLSWVRAYTAHRGELKRIFMVQKLHLGHVAKSFALKQQPSVVGKAFQKQSKKRKREQKPKGLSKRRKITNKR
ncbi:DEAD-box ATP-dependent RNA helicase 17 isoform X1 [Ricinus communis]|uniref:ATP-dependent RNA helicase n=1 Tax=Ricinus communis TaxID=3988 RepID=B9SLR6_RICCO|nr:DEAD-box ATP-dependent RNA helicase 17 isoform X1 [Ricinus communis]EEF35422.1 dead box ATP-dependent RNA helicase, putative [Ricinus communis]|eukprot:XP_002526935.1 DEAD-box ATP-dependent RNA helicase 17 isoform X1 [Ricinus communis]